MKKISLLFLISIITFGEAAIAYAIHESVPSETQIVMPGPDAAKAQYVYDQR